MIVRSFDTLLAAGGAARIAILAATLAFLVSCSPAFTTRARLASSFHSIASSAAETELFIDRLQEAKVTSAYAGTYADSLADSVREARQELRSRPPARGLETAFAECMRQNDLLLDSVNNLKLARRDRGALAAARSRIESIRRAAERSRTAL
jgi:hypothetical protein